ncbi:MAG TPA: VWA domain-containing protein [Candidatus Sulfotelmatobacter sp.]|nr:VWA domain-containing protein [Candidatus Sulfotelmatobacter sp.]
MESVGLSRKTGKNENWERTTLAALAGIALAFAWALSSAVPARAQSGASQPATQEQKQAPQDIPDAPSTVQPPVAPPPERLDKPPVTPPATDQHPARKPDDSSSTTENPPPPPMPPVETLPPGTTTAAAPVSQSSKDDLLKFVVRVNSVQVPVMVKDRDGRRVDGLRPKDFTVLENGKPQQLSYFTTDPFELSVAVVIDLGMPDVAVQKINQTFSALVEAFSIYDEVAIYTYSSTVSQVSSYQTTGQKLTAVLNTLKTETGHNNGVAVLSGPMASGPVVNGIPVGSPSVPVNTPSREAHVLNDAILRAALDLSKRDRTRRKVIFVISDGRELGSQASFRDVLRVLLAQGIQVKAAVVEGSAIPVYNKLEKFHLPLQGYNDILPKYTAATGGGQVYSGFSRNTIENAYADITSDVRNQYTLGYLTRATISEKCNDLEVKIDHPGLKIYTRDRVCPAASRAR